MIPKKIHYCWFGKGPMPQDALNCIESWKKHCKDYELILWNENNFDINSNEYVKEAYEKRKFAFVADYVRLYALYTYGGIYMDTDIEIIKSLDGFLNNKAFSGFENDSAVQTGIMACEKELPIFKELLDYYKNRHFIDENGNMDLTTNVVTITNILKKYNLECNNSYQVVANITLYPSEYFCPIDCNTRKKKITDNTVAIHWFAGSWISKNEKLKVNIYNFLEKLVGKNILMKIKRFVKRKK